jgi:hypothetical protein
MIRKDALDALKHRDAASFVESVAALAFGGSSPRGDQHLLVVDVDTHHRLEAISSFLVKRGLHLSKNGNFADFAMMHGRHVLAMPCDWLIFERGHNEVHITFRSPCEHVAHLEDYTTDPSDAPWLDQAGHGFMLASEDNYEAWLDFDSGTTVVSFK